MYCNIIIKDNFEAQHTLDQRYGTSSCHEWIGSDLLFIQKLGLIINSLQTIVQQNEAIFITTWKLELRKKKLCYEMTKTTSYYLRFLNTYDSATSNNSCLWRLYKLIETPSLRPKVWHVLVPWMNWKWSFIYSKTLLDHK